MSSLQSLPTLQPRSFSPGVLVHVSPQPQPELPSPSDLLRPFADKACLVRHSKELCRNLSPQKPSAPRYEDLLNVLFSLQRVVVHRGIDEPILPCIRVAKNQFLLKQVHRLFPVARLGVSKSLRNAGDSGLLRKPKHLLLFAPSGLCEQVERTHLPPPAASGSNVRDECLRLLNTANSPIAASADTRDIDKALTRMRRFRPCAQMRAKREIKHLHDLLAWDPFQCKRGGVGLAGESEKAAKASKDSTDCEVGMLQPEAAARPHVDI